MGARPPLAWQSRLAPCVCAPALAHRARSRACIAHPSQPQPPTFRAHAPHQLRVCVFVCVCVCVCVYTAACACVCVRARACVCILSPPRWRMYIDDRVKQTITSTPAPPVACTQPASMASGCGLPITPRSKATTACRWPAQVGGGTRPGLLMLLCATPARISAPAARGTAVCVALRHGVPASGMLDPR